VVDDDPLVVAVDTDGIHSECVPGADGKAAGDIAPLDRIGDEDSTRVDTFVGCDKSVDKVGDQHRVHISGFGEEDSLGAVHTGGRCGILTVPGARDDHRDRGADACGSTQQFSGTGDQFTSG